jgi:hypothetical protein
MMLALTAACRGSLNREDAKNAKSSHQRSLFASFASWRFTNHPLSQIVTR